MKEIRVWMTAVAATGSCVLNVPAHFLSSKDSIGIGKVSMAISLETLAAPTCNKKGKVSHHQDRSPRFKCPFEECDNMFTTVLQLSSHCKSEHDTNLGKYLNYGHV